MQSPLTRRTSCCKGPSQAVLRRHCTLAQQQPFRPATGRSNLVSCPSRATKAEAEASVRSPVAEHGPSDASSTQQCPFLATLSMPPLGAQPWYKRLGQMFSPVEWQQQEIGQHTVVATPAALGMPAQYMVGDAELAQAVFSAEPEAMERCAPNSRIAQLLGQEHLLAVQDPQHKYLRGLIMPSFTADSIASYTPRMTAVIRKYLERWSATPGAVEGVNELKQVTFEFIIAIVMGKDYPADVIRTMNRKFRAFLAGLSDWPYIDLPFTKFHKALLARQELLDWLLAEVREARQAVAGGDSLPGVLGKMMAAQDEQGNRLTDSQLANNLLVLLFAGHDTSSSTLVHVLKQLQQHPAAVEALRQEQAAITACHGDAIDGRILKEMVYTDAVIRETLRLDTIVSGLFRKATKDFALGAYKATEGTLLYLPLQLLSKRDPRWVGAADVDEFRPERMLQPDGQKPGWLMPFGYGPRFCVGYSLAMAEMKVFLALLVRSYDFSVDINTGWDTSPTGRIPRNGLPLMVVRRG